MSKVRLAVAAFIVAAAGVIGAATTASAGTPLDTLPNVSVPTGLHLCC